MNAAIGTEVTAVPIQLENPALMTAAYTQPELEILTVRTEAGFAISQPHGGELGPSSEDYADDCEY